MTKLTPEQVLRDIQTELAHPTSIPIEPSIISHLAQARESQRLFRTSPVIGALAGFKKIFYSLIHSTFSQQYDINDALLNLIEELYNELEVQRKQLNQLQQQGVRSRE